MAEKQQQSMEQIVQSTHENSFFQSCNEEPSLEMDCSTLESNTENRNSASDEKPLTLSSRKNTGGGITCCVPLCYNNSKRNPELSFYVIPKDPTLRKKWINQLSRKDFRPTQSHRVCSAHFSGGKKTYMNNIPTIVPKTIQTRNKKPRTSMNSSGCRSFMSPNKPSTTEQLEVELSLEEELNKEIKYLQRQLQGLRIEITAQEKKYKEELDSLEKTLQNNIFTVDRFKHNQTHFKFYTGFESYELFSTVLEFLKPAASSLIYWGSNTNMENKTSEDVIKRGRSRTLSTEEEFFLILTRLRCAFPLQDLATRFNMSTSHISRILITWIDFLHSQFRMLPIWASKKTVMDQMPKCFKEQYPQTRVILDCTELFIEMPTSYRSQSATFSSYKHHNTAKGLVGIAPNGLITFVSDLYTGMFSDKRITKDTGLYSLLEPGDSVMADRGFDIDEDLPADVTLNIPPFLKGEPQLTLQDENETRKIAAVRVHVERAIERVKNYKLLSQVFPLTMAAELNKIWIICCYLVNFLPQLVPDRD